jgi:hypothetical protein
MTTEIDETTSNLPEGLTLDEHGNMQAPLSILRVKAGFNPARMPPRPLSCSLA